MHTPSRKGFYNLIQTTCTFLRDSSSGVLSVTTGSTMSPCGGGGGGGTLVKKVAPVKRVMLDCSWCNSHCETSNRYSPTPNGPFRPDSKINVLRSALKRRIPPYCHRAITLCSLGWSRDSAWPFTEIRQLPWWPSTVVNISAWKTMYSVIKREAYSNTCNTSVHTLLSTQHSNLLTASTSVHTLVLWTQSVVHTQ